MQGEAAEALRAAIALHALNTAGRVDDLEAALQVAEKLVIEMSANALQGMRAETLIAQARARLRMMRGQDEDAMVTDVTGSGGGGAAQGSSDHRSAIGEGRVEDDEITEEDEMDDATFEQLRLEMEMLRQGSGGGSDGVSGGGSGGSSGEGSGSGGGGGRECGCGGLRGETDVAASAGTRALKNLCQKLTEKLEESIGQQQVSADGREEEPTAEPDQLIPSRRLSSPTLLESMALMDVAVGRGEQRAEVDDSCCVCMASPRNASLVHGETAHICCCIDCARALKARGNPCPICNDPIDAVLRNFVS